jgi:hypothetical protein
MAVSPTGPRFDPLIVTDTPPAVGMLSRLYPTGTDTSLITGAAYDDVTLTPDSALTNDATVTVHRYPDPTPTTLTHRIVVCATVTSHDVAVSVRPVEPPLYTATTGGTNSPAAGLGPKLLPPNTTSPPPDVPITPTIVADVTTGDAYDSVDTDHDPFCPPTSTRHCRPPPTPATLLHWAPLWPDPVTTHDDATYSTPYTALRYTTRSTADVGPKLLPDSCTVSPPAVPRPPALDPGNDVTTAAVYDVVAMLHAPTTPPTLTRHTCPYPTPTALAHRTRT